VKAILLIYVVLQILTIQSIAQTGRESIGAAGGGYYVPAQLSPEQRKVIDDRFEKIRVNEIYNLVNGQVYRTVGGKAYNVLKTTWRKITGKLYEKDNGIVILEQGDFKYIAVTNYFGNEMDSQLVVAVAMRIGNYDMGGRPIEFWDCGTLPAEEQLKQIKDEEAKAQALIDKQKAEELKAVQVKNYAAQAKAIIWLQSQATNGSVSAQCSLGLHYLNGQGCETNKTLAIEWLQKAAAQGDSEASNKLAELK